MFVQVGDGRRPVDWCRNSMPVLYVYLRVVGLSLSSVSTVSALVLTTLRARIDTGPVWTHNSDLNPCTGKVL